MFPTRKYKLLEALVFGKGLGQGIWMGANTNNCKNIAPNILILNEY